MKSANPKSGFHEAEVAQTLDTFTPTPQKAQGGQMIVEQHNDASFWNGDDVAGTLTCKGDQQFMPDKGRLQCVIEPKVESAECRDTRQENVLFPINLSVTRTAVSKDIVPMTSPAIGIGRDAFNQGKNAKYCMCFAEDLQPTLTSKGPGAVCFEHNPTDSRLKEVPVSPTVLGRWGTGGNQTPLVMEGRKSVPDIIGFIKNDAGGLQQGFWKNVFPTLRAAITPAITWNECFHLSFCDANGTRKDRKNGGLYVTKAENSQMVTPKGPHTETVIIALDGDKMAKAERKGDSGLGVSEDGVMNTQTAKNVHAVAYDECVPLDLRNATRDPEKHDEQNRQGVGVGEDGAPMNTVTAASVPGVGWQATVRRLLPIECERLMGFPDNWTRIVWKGKPEEECPDAPRYKACGNSMCVNVMAWLGERIDEVNRKIPSREGIFENGGQNE